MKFGCSSTLMLAAVLVTVHHITSSPLSNACDSCSSPFFTPRYRVLLLGGIFSSAVMSTAANISWSTRTSWAAAVRGAPPPPPRPPPPASHRPPRSLYPRLLQSARYPALLGHGPRRKRVCRAARLLLARGEQVRRWSRPGHRAAHGAAAATRACSRYQCPTLTITTTAPHLAH